MRELPEAAAPAAPRVRRTAAAVAAATAALAASACGGGTAARTGTTTSTSAAAGRPAPITERSVSEHLRALQRIADRHGGSRAAGRPGDRATAEYIAAELRKAGWRVRFQTVTFPYFTERGRPRLGDLERGEDFRVLEYSPGGDVTAVIRPLDTQACDEAELGPVQDGEIALVARGRCTFRRKAISAQRAGAAALVVVDREGRRPPAATLGRPSGVDIPVVAVTADAAARLARTADPVRLRVDTVSEQRESRNVIADTAAPPAGRKVVMAGAHLDSVEEGPGINDNASGVAALLETARLLDRRPGLRLGFWAAEELGLYGSRRYVRSLGEAERKAIAAYVNLDMVGSPNPRPVVYDSDNRVERALRRAHPGDEGETGLGGASDHAPFDRAGIPVGGLFTGASERTDPCYHRACDTIRSVDAPITATMARATAGALEQLSER